MPVAAVVRRGLGQVGAIAMGGDAASPGYEALVGEHVGANHGGGGRPAVCDRAHTKMRKADG